MSNLKHTPGKWVVFFKHKYREWHVGIPSEHSFKFDLNSNGIPPNDLDKLEESEANARLIAAAPEMLKALINIYNYSNNDSTDKYFLRETRDLIERATGMKIEEIEE
jgi:hypothetical protein